MIDLNIQLPEHFLDAEEREGHIVSAEMKTIWAVELDLLSAFMSVCERNQLNYFADGGTLLGALRHGGFIPWDDDIDIVMMRPDYDKLCVIASREFSDPYFFQTSNSDPGSCFHHAKLRNSRTTAIIKKERDKRYNQGIWIDIFPLDSLPDDKNLLGDYLSTLIKKQRELGLYRGYISDYKHKLGVVPSLKHWLKHIYIKHIWKGSRTILSICQEIDAELTKYKSEKSMMVSNLSIIWLSIPRKLFWQRSWFAGEPRFVKFEFLSIPIPPQGELLLDKLYGNWHVFVKDASCHSTVLFDTSHPYTDYIIGE